MFLHYSQEAEGDSTVSVESDASSDSSSCQGDDPSKIQSVSEYQKFSYPLSTQ